MLLITKGNGLFTRRLLFECSMCYANPPCRMMMRWESTWSWLSLVVLQDHGCKCKIRVSCQF